MEDGRWKKKKEREEDRQAKEGKNKKADEAAEKAGYKHNQSMANNDRKLKVTE